MKQKTAFIDRDGTINVNVEYLDNPNDLHIYPDVAKGIKRLQDHEFKIIVISNQSGIARGYFSEETLQQIHERIQEELAKEQASIDDFFYCPHHPDDGCDCRKPKTGLFEQAIKKYNIDVSQSFVIGDRMLDVEAGYNLGLITILIPENVEFVKEERRLTKIEPNYICDDFYSAVEWIVQNQK